MRICARFSAMTILCGQAFSQSTEKPQFDVAEVRSSPSTNQQVSRGPFFTSGPSKSGRYELRFATMLDMIRIAYGVDPERVSGAYFF